MTSRGVSLLILSWTLMCVSTIVVTLRCYARLLRIGLLKAENYCMVLAIVSLLNENDGQAGTMLIIQTSGD